MTNDRKILTTAVAILLVALCIFLLSRSGGRKEKDFEDDGTIINLNEVLVNSDVPELYKMDRQIERFLSQWCIHGATLAVTRNDSLVYVKGYGESDSLEAIVPGTKFRLASISKLITATGIMLLKDQGLIHLSDKVFGEGGILDGQPYTEVIKDKRYYKITVEHLLRHTAGFSTRSGDPLFPDKDYLARNGFAREPERDELVKCVLKRRLASEPGPTARYSNFGYLLLSMVIEQVTGTPYEEWIQANLLQPCRCMDFHIGGTFIEDRLPGETRYYCHAGETLTPCILDTSKLVERCYGGSDLKTLSGAGGWVASAPEMARFICCIDKIPEIQDFLSPTILEQMTEVTEDSTFGIGWNDITEKGEWTRTGTLSCTSALIKRYPDGQCWILITNTGTWKGPRFTRYIAGLFRKCRETYSNKLPDVDLFKRAVEQED